MSDERLEVEVGPPAHGGHCVARLDGDGTVVFVRHALPGERVVAEVTERRRRFWRAEAVEVLEPSADRVPSVWPEAGPGGVGGGELGHVRPAAQRRWKRDVLAQTLRRIGGADLAAEVAALPESAGEAAPPVAALPGDESRGGLRTRSRIALTVAGDGRAGMHRHRSREVVPLAELPLAHEAIADLGLLGDSPWRRRWRPGSRVEAVAPSAPGAEPLVLVDGEPPRRRGSAPPRRAVREVVSSAVGELSYRVSGSGFWQVHREAPGTLADAVLRGAGGAQTADRGAAALAGRGVLELYSGAGLLTLPLARAAGEGGAVVSVEGDARAVKDARRNLHDHPQVVLGEARIDPATAREAAAELPGGPEVIVLDPPRAGAGQGLMAALAGLGAERIVLVSCDPAALARDLAAARPGGYGVTRLEAFDLFPHTHHLETVATLTRR